MLAEPICYKRKCKFFIGVKNDGDESTERYYCKAYPDNIPNDILSGEDKHLTIRDDQQNTIVYERARE